MRSSLMRSTHIFGVPMVIVSQIRAEDETALVQTKGAVANGIITKQQLLDQKDESIESMGGISDSLIDQMAVAFLKQEYESIGLDTGKIQLDYMLSVGMKMLGVTLLSVAAAVIVGLLARRTAAGVAMQLRSRVFKKVVSFSNAELDRFSTASLITRSTNDIQQMQMVIVMMLRMVLYAPILGIGGIIKVAEHQDRHGLDHRAWPWPPF